MIHDVSPDAPPVGYALASNRHLIDVCGMVFRPDTASRDASWDRPKRGENLIGSTVHEHWPDIMAYALPIPKAAQ